MDTIHTNVAERVESTIQPLLAPQGYELVLAEFIPRQRVLRLYIDHPEGVSLEDCSEVSRLVGDVLDIELKEPLPERYTLEVSSPGLDRPLTRPAHFQRFVGEAVQLECKVPRDGRRRYRGNLVAADDAGLRLLVDGAEWAFSYQELSRANLVPRFGGSVSGRS